MNKKQLGLVVALMPAMMVGSAQADTVFGVYFDAKYWQYDTDGNIGSGSDQATFDFDQEQRAILSIALEHPIPLLPNLKIRQSVQKSTGSTTLTSNFTYDGRTYLAGSTIGADLDFSHTDFTLYYEILDNDVVSFDIGVSGQKYDGYATVIDQNGNRNELAFNGVIPTGYLAAQIGIPGTGFNFYGEGYLLSIDDSSLRDIDAGIEYRFIENVAADVSLQVGYRTMKVELDDLDGLYSDISFKGPYIGLKGHF
ncbi:hypothetical protein CWI84_03430 [Idiomarina tyrosinivorans]|uniref:TIGR04219 family outer membrane beta-barrel protein n=1 Tax=Idiomarina tyrosinivorans TaxID=1445662 RepID=A0A432ZS42_9GAMM|nr:TIGR04219 family outer membrane beta-barrel protein [Idiomarina tyrosinivorans]RUO80651.1 hypothetical protein CWI84_03430 [Idiomarina tyrosinivorans]